MSGGRATNLWGWLRPSKCIKGETRETPPNLDTSVRTAGVISTPLEGLNCDGQIDRKAAAVAEQG